jgi:hypothetical protein
MIRHIRKSGHQIDRRFRMGGIHHRVSHGGTFCGEPETIDDFARDNAEATVKHAAIFKARNEPKRVVETAAELCSACLREAGIEVAA